MKEFTHWHDFYVFVPRDFNVSIDDRLGLTENGKKGLLIIESSLVLADDPLECMIFGEFGEVSIWTKKRVWCVRHENGADKLIFLYRNPEDSSAKI